VGAMPPAMDWDGQLALRPGAAFLLIPVQ
jgi:hypothetical protein